MQEPRFLKDGVPVVLLGGPLDGSFTDRRCTYLDANGDPVGTTQGDQIRRSKSQGLYYRRGTRSYTWNNVEPAGWEPR